MKTLLAVLLSLFLTTPVLADYSGSAVLDWSSLTFTGVPVLLNGQDTPILQAQGWNLVNMLPPLEPNPAFQGTGNSTFGDWAPLTITASLPGVGSVESTATATQLLAAGTLDNGGLVDSGISRTSGFQISQSGELVVHINYHLSQQGTPLLVPGWENQAAVGLYFGDKQVTDTLSSTSIGSRDGTLTLTSVVQAGDSGVFAVTASLLSSPQASRGGSVPLPGMLWPTTFLGLAGLGWLWVREWRRVR